MTEQENKITFRLDKLYVKDISLEVPRAPKIFLEQGTPEVHMEIKTTHQALETDFYDVAVSVAVTAKFSDDNIVFINEVTQCGIFQIAGVSEEDLKVVLNVSCPNILFPYVREVVSSETSRAGFPPILLEPISFEVLYHQQQQQNAANDV